MPLAVKSGWIRSGTGTTPAAGTVVRTCLRTRNPTTAERPHDAFHPLAIDPQPGILELDGDARSPIGALGLGVNRRDPAGKPGVRTCPPSPRIRAGQVPVKPGTGEPQDPAHPLVSPTKYSAAPAGSRVSDSSSFTHTRNRLFSISSALASTTPDTAACSASRTQVRSASRSTPRSLTTHTNVRPQLKRYNTTASTQNSGKYLNLPNTNPCPSDLKIQRSGHPRSSSRGGAHPSALTEPCVKVSRYTALVVLIFRSCRRRW